MALKPKLTVDQEDFESGWRETRDIFSLDVVLRKHGFKIYSRAKGEEAKWSKDGVVYTFTEALRLCPRNEVQQASGAGKTLKGGLGKV